jgi:hypothetical protein
MNTLDILERLESYTTAIIAVMFPVFTVALFL